MKRVGNAFKGVLGGFILIIVGIGLLWWNEENNVKNIKTTAEMEKIVIDVKSDKVDPKNEGKLIATNGKLINEQELVDEIFNIKLKTPKMKRIVEIFQWDEHSSTNDDGKTTYSYSKKWSSDIIDSGNFHNKNKVNPKTKQYEDEIYTSTDVKVGAFSLSSNQISNLSTKGIITDFNPETLSSLNLKASGKYITNSSDLDNPKIGDIRISFVYNNSSDLSVLAVQQGSTFVSYISSYDKEENRVMDGIHSSKEIINVIKEENNFLKWILRLIGILLIVFGFATILKPISAVTSYVPLLGSLVGAAVGLISLILGLIVGLIIIAIAWIRYRPIVGITAIVIVVALIVFLIIRSKKTKEKENKA